jgi:hypothetical protein
MKEIKKEIIRKDYTYEYESFDGSLFDTKEECEKYEKSAEGVLKLKFQDLIVDKQDAWDLMRGYEDNDVIGIKLTKEEDKDTVLQFYLFLNPHLLNESERYKEWLEQYRSYINEAFEKKDLLLMGINCEGDYYFIGPRNKFIENLKNFGKPVKSEKR